MLRFPIPRLVVRVLLLAVMLVSVAHAQVRQPLAPARPVQTALPTNGVLPSDNPLAHAPDVRGLAPHDAMVTRVLHFLGHLFGGPSTQQTMPSPFHESCGVRPCPYDMRN